MRSRTTPIILTRGRIAQWGSMFGSAALLAGILGFIWQGSLSEIVIITFAFGIAGIALWAILTPQDFAGFITGRRVRYGTVTFFSTLLLIGIVALAYVLLRHSLYVRSTGSRLNGCVTSWQSPQNSDCVWSFE